MSTKTIPHPIPLQAQCMKFRLTMQEFHSVGKLLPQSTAHHLSTGLMIGVFRVTLVIARG